MIAIWYQWVIRGKIILVEVETYAGGSGIARAAFFTNKKAHS